MNINSLITIHDKIAHLADLKTQLEGYLRVIVSKVISCEQYMLNLMKNFRVMVRAVLFLILATILLRTDTFAQHPQISGPNYGLRVLRYNTDGSVQLITANTEISTPILETAAMDLEGIPQVAASVARQVILSYLPQIKGAEIRQTSCDQVGDLWVSTYQMAYNGIPVRERALKMNIGAKNGKVVSLYSTFPKAQPNIATAMIPELLATQTAFTDIGTSTDTKLTQSPQLVYCVADENQTLRLAYELVISEGNSHQWRYTIDAETSQLLDKRDLVVCHTHGSEESVTDTASFQNDNAPTANALPLSVQHEAQQLPQAEESGKLYAMVVPTAPTDTEIKMPLPNTLLTINGKQVISDTLGNWSLTDGTYPLQVSGVLSSTNQILRANLSGSIAKLDYTVQAGGSKDIIWDDLNSDRAERNAYYHTLLIRNHVLSVDKALTSLSTKKVYINVNIDDACNAFYNAQDNSVNFFRANGGCVNTALIPDVVYHEFGHRVNHLRYQKAGKGYMFDGSLNEGYADVVSCLFRDSSVIGIGFTGKNTKLRNINNTNKWPTSINTADTHINGLMPAGSIWDVRKKIGRDKTLTLFHQSGYQTPDGTGSFKPGPLLDVFWQSLESMLIVDDDNNNLADGTPNAAAIIESYAKHNIGAPQFIDIRPVITPDQTRSADSYPLQAKVQYNSIAAFIDRSSVKAHYSVDNGKTYSEVVLTDNGNDMFGGSIPKAAVGTIVKYYFSAGLTYSGVSRVTYPPAGEPLTFLVDIPRASINTCESESGWELGDANTDVAQQGNWENAVPFGTYTAEGTPYIQQDSDHTATGSRCFVTGNSSSPFANSNTIDTGSVTLVSPAFDLSSYKDPIMRYWYYYRNDEREISSTPIWTVKISNNGTTYTKNIQNTSTITKGWTPVTFRVKDMIAPTSTVYLKFIANNKLRAVIEAGVDDIEIFEMPTNAVSDERSSTISLRAPYPNPVSSELQITVPFTLERSEPYVIRILDISGNEVIVTDEHRGNSGENSILVTLPKTTANGSYIIELSTPSSIKAEKFVVAK